MDISIQLFYVNIFIPGFNICIVFFLIMYSLPWKRTMTSYPIVFKNLNYFLKLKNAERNVVWIFSFSYFMSIYLFLVLTFLLYFSNNVQFLIFTFYVQNYFLNLATYHCFLWVGKLPKPNLFEHFIVIFWLYIFRFIFIYLAKHRET